MRHTQRERQAEERREQLIDTALRLFARQGFDNTSIKDLAEAAGVAQGLFYHYFRNKEELLFAAIERQSFRAELRRLLVAPSDKPAAEVLLQIATDFSALTAERDLVLRLIAREAPTNPQVAAMLQRVIQEAVALLAEYLEARIQAGELRPHDPAVTARTLFYMVVMLHLTRTPTDEFIPALVSTLLHGISAGG